MAAEAIRIGVIGCGFYAQNHLHAWRELAPEGAVLAAVCDIDAGKAEAAGRAFGVPFYTDANALLASEQLDVVDIVTRQDTHRALCELTIARGLATIVQKPFAPTWEDCIAIVEAAEKAGVWLAVHENFRFQAPMRHVRAGDRQRRDRHAELGAHPLPHRLRCLRDAALFPDARSASPSPMSASTCSTSRASSWARSPASPARRSSATRRCAARIPRPCCFGTRAARVSVVECTYEARRSPDPFPETLVEIEGPRGSIIVDTGCRMTVTSDGETSETDIAAPLLSWTSHPWHVSQEGALGACRHFLDCLQRGVAAETSGEDNLKSYALVDAAYRAAAEHGQSPRRSGKRAARISRRRAGGRGDDDGPRRRANEERGSAAAFAITVAFELVEGAFPEFHRLVAENAALSVELEPDCLRFDVLTPADPAVRRMSSSMRFTGTARPSTCISLRIISASSTSARATWWSARPL